MLKEMLDGIFMGKLTLEKAFEFIRFYEAI